ncbi:MAG TPA: DUF4143 domain-containing protein, partial [Rectinema sp.]|nr:DUF4143 domain-containing protein [Rectinema sp.]
SLLELRQERAWVDIYREIESYLVFGLYPEVLGLGSAAEKTEYLVNLRNSYLFKDILALEQLRNSQKLQDIVRLLAFQVGNEVSLNELATQTGLSKNTVQRYLDLLEKAFIIKKVGAFSRNLRSEISKSAKYYFWDVGVRNAVINDFRPVELRNDVGALWENFVVMELLKKYEYEHRYANFYFWRTYDQKELDLVIEEKSCALWLRNQMARQYGQNSEAVARHVQGRGECDHEGKPAGAVGTRDFAAVKAKDMITR